MAITHFTFYTRHHVRTIRGASVAPDSQVRVSAMLFCTACTTSKGTTFDVSSNGTTSKQYPENRLTVGEV